MGISKKGRNTLKFSNRTFTWWVAMGDEGQDVLTVASEDKHFFVRYQLEQSDDRFLIIEGCEFPGLADAGGCHIRIYCPQWEKDNSITPRSIRELLEWCLQKPDRPLQRCDWRGKQIR